MRLEQILATLIIALLAGTIGAYLVSTGRDPLQSQPAAIVTTLAQVASSGKLRCGYIEEDPAFAKEANGAFSGIWYRLSEALGDAAKLEIVWTTPTKPETLAADLKAKKFDALCTGFASTLILAKDLGFSAPAYLRDGKPYGFVTQAKDVDLRDFLSQGMQALQTSGEIEKILQKYPQQTAQYQRVKAP